MKNSPFRTTKKTPFRTSEKTAFRTTVKTSYHAQTSKLTAEVVIEAETGEELAEMLKGLDKKYARVLFLHYYYNMSLKEISGIFGEKYNTIQSRHTRALKKLNKICTEKENF